MGNASRGGKGRFGFGVALSLLLVAHCATLRPALALVQEKDDGSKAFDLEYGQHIVDFNTVVYCPDGREIESWTCPTCRKNTTKNFQVDQVIHEFEINIQAYTGYSPTLGTFGHIQPSCSRSPSPPWELTTPPPASLLPSSATQMPSFSCSGGPSQTTSETGSSTLAFWSSTWICPIQTRTAPRSTGKDFVALAPIGVFVTLTPLSFFRVVSSPFFLRPAQWLLQGIRHDKR